MKNELFALLESNHYKFDFDTTSFEYGDLVDKGAIYNIYKRRLMISDKVTRELVDNIKFSQGDKIRLNKIIDKNKDEYLVFTNEQISSFIGILKLSNG